MTKHNTTFLGKLIDRKLGLPENFDECSYEDAIRLCRFAIRARPNEPFLYFYLAGFYSRINEINKSLFYYEQALKRGFKDWEQIYGDESFESARNTQKFNMITANYARRSNSPPTRS